MSAEEPVAFEITDRFDDIHGKIREPVHGAIEAEMQSFEENYNRDGPDSILGRFDLKEMDRQPGYRLKQIRVTNQYRAAILFVDDEPLAYYVHLFKKTKDRETHEWELAKSRAQRFWDESSEEE